MAPADPLRPRQQRGETANETSMMTGRRLKASPRAKPKTKKGRSRDGESRGAIIGAAAGLLPTDPRAASRPSSSARLDQGRYVFEPPGESVSGSFGAHGCGLRVAGSCPSFAQQCRDAESDGLGDPRRAGDELGGLCLLQNAGSDAPEGAPGHVAAASCDRSGENWCFRWWWQRFERGRRNKMMLLMVAGPDDSSYQPGRNLRLSKKVSSCFF